MELPGDENVSRRSQRHPLPALLSTVRHDVRGARAQAGTVSVRTQNNFPSNGEPAGAGLGEQNVQ